MQCLRNVMVLRDTSFAIETTATTLRWVGVGNLRKTQMSSRMKNT